MACEGAALAGTSRRSSDTPLSRHSALNISDSAANERNQRHHTGLTMGAIFAVLKMISIASCSATLGAKLPSFDRLVASSWPAGSRMAQRRDPLVPLAD
jgi:hypothetical protein